jgi:HTH-type transcriptional regulator / antitoxin HigA
MKTLGRKTRLPGRLPGIFEALNGLRPLWPILDEADYDNANEIAGRLAVLERRTRGQDQYLETLSLLIEDYDEAHHAIDTSHIGPIEALKYLLERNGMNASDLGRLLGNRAAGAKILNGTRALSKGHIRKLCEHFQVSADLFI